MYYLKTLVLCVLSELMACYHNDDKFGDDFEKDEIMNFSDDNDEDFSVDEDVSDADGGVGRGFREIS